MEVELHNIEEVVRQEMEGDCTQKTISYSYAFALLSSQLVDWKKINKMIIDKWSIDGLETVKKMAWKLVEEKGMK